MCFELLSVWSELGDAAQNEDLDGKPGNQNVLIKRLLKPNVPTTDQALAPSRMSEVSLHLAFVSSKVSFCFNN